MTTQISALVNEITTLRAEPVPAIDAWRAVCNLVRGSGAKFTKQLSGWGRDHYADANACGGNSESRYTGTVGVVLGSQRSMVAQGGGQNGGHYYYDAAADDCLFFSTDGAVYEVYQVDGAWSQWQGSSSGYTLSWRKYNGPISDDALDEALNAVVIALAAHRESLRAKKQAGAGAASRIIAALTSAQA